MPISPSWFAPFSGLVLVGHDFDVASNLRQFQFCV